MKLGIAGISGVAILVCYAIIGCEIARADEVPPDSLPTSSVNFRAGTRSGERGPGVLPAVSGHVQFCTLDNRGDLHCGPPVKMTIVAPRATR